HGFYLDVDFDRRAASGLMRFRSAPAARGELDALRRGAQARDARIAALNSRIAAMEATTGWRMLERLRRTRDALAPALRVSQQYVRAVRRSVEVLFAEGPSAFGGKVAKKVRRVTDGRPLWDESPEVGIPDLDAQYRLWLEQHTLGAAGLARLAAAS